MGKKSLTNKFAMEVDRSDEKRKAAELKAVGGSDFDEFNNVIIKQTVNTLWLGFSNEDHRERTVQGAVYALTGLAPQDELEGMLIAQMIACHSASMECFRRAMLKDQPFEGRKGNLNQANKLSRTYIQLMAALNKHRGKGQQKVTVEHVHVHKGGQAIVGTVQQGGGDNKKTREQSHAK